MPRIGSESADRSIGAEMTHVSIEVVVSNSVAMSVSDTDRIVMGNDVANMPASAATRTQRE